MYCIDPELLELVPNWVSTILISLTTAAAVVLLLNVIAAGIARLGDRLPNVAREWRWLGRWWRDRRHR